MSTAEIKSWSELVEYADNAINYPFESFLEKHISPLDKITDIVCAAVIIAEDIGDNEGETKNMLARRMLHAYLETTQWHPFIVKVIDTALIFAIEGAVALLDSLFPAGWDNLLGLLFDSIPNLGELFPKFIALKGAPS